MRIIPFAAGHLDLLALQGGQSYLVPLIDGGYAAALERMGPAFTAVADGRVVGVAGVAPQWRGRAVAWALLSECGPPVFLAVHRAALRFFALQGYRRIEAGVDVRFTAAQRWARLLGFEREGLMRGYGPDGHDAYLYARVRM